MRYRLRTLLILLAIMAGCDHFPRDNRMEILKHGGEAVEKHAKEIERAANQERPSGPNP